MLCESLVFSSGLGQVVAIILWKIRQSQEFFMHPVLFLFHISTCRLLLFVLDAKKMEIWFS